MRAGIATWLGVGLMLGWAWPAAAGGLQVETGKWEITTVFRAPMTQEDQTRTATECIEESEVTPQQFIQHLQGCTLSDVVSGAREMSWKMECEVAGGTMTGEADLRSTGTTLKGSMQLRMEHGGMTMDMRQSWEGERLGDC